MEPLLDLELLRTFSAVVKAGELKKAAEQVYRSHAAVSMQLKRLEEQLGTRLMERNNRGIRLTEAGETLLSYSEQLLRLNQAALSALTEEQLSGKLRFGIPTDYAQDFLNHFMPMLSQELPRLDARVSCDRSRNLRPMVTRGELDIAIVAGEEDSIDEELLWSERLIWAAPRCVRLEDAEKLPIALHEDNCIVRDLCLEGLKRSGRPYQQVFGSTMLDNVASAVHAGFAISLLPESVINPQLIRPLPSALLGSDVIMKINMIAAPQIEPQVRQKLASCLRQAAQQHEKASYQG
ncbi:LysR family transcriptional regulator [Marinobacterium jannaschii]|uniref:LysR family transcriptional regulator n=1 Tax=Marinobacterium jannaschii TaxID=64970 RepID=UPI000562278A|nr:LysR family transcriptional regulator [Marinobacterium jannaschii]